MPVPVARIQVGKLETTYYTRAFGQTSTCWNCGELTDLACPGLVSTGFYCSRCEVLWRERR